jgi:hypothetical protein
MISNPTLLGFPAATFIAPLIRARVRVATLAIMMWYTLCGAIGVPLVWNAIWGPGNRDIGMMPVGIIAGLVAGACFCLIALYAPLPRAWQKVIASRDSSTPPSPA